MSPRRRMALLIGIMAFVVLVVESSNIGLLYFTTMGEERSRLEETAKGQARLIESVAAFDKIYSDDYPFGSKRATLDQIRAAHEKYKGFGKTGEFTLSTKEGENIIFLLNHRHYDLDNPKPVAWDSNLAEPMRLALSGKSGTIIGLDYRGETVLAAYEPITELNWGIVAKIDLAEIREPFIKSAVISGVISLAFIFIGTALFFRITDPILKKLSETVRNLETALKEVKTLRGIIPICSYCKKIRNDKGYWDQVDVYIHQHTEADFSHGICPQCLERYYPDVDVPDETDNK